MKRAVKRHLKEIFMYVADACDGSFTSEDVAAIKQAYREAMRDEHVRDLYTKLTGKP